MNMNQEKSTSLILTNSAKHCCLSSDLRERIGLRSLDKRIGVASFYERQMIPSLELDQRVFQINTIDYLLKCIIQTHFCVFLVRRSRTLRNLKGLALFKSTFNSLNSLISSETHFDFDAVSQKAMELLLKLDSIQVNDSWVFVILFKVWLL